MIKDIFKKISKPQNEVEDLDIGYDSEYYSGYNRESDRRAEEPRMAAEPAGDRWAERSSEPVRDRWEEPSSIRGGDDYYNSTAGGWQEPPVSGYRAFAEEKSEPVMSPAPAPEYLYFTPSTYRDCREGIVKGLSAGHVVVVRVVNLETSDVLRLFDYMMGAVLALEGEMVRPRSNMVVLLPHDVQLDEDALELGDDEDEDYDGEDEEYDDESDEDDEYEEEYEEEDEAEDDEAYDRYDNKSDYEAYDDNEEESDEDAE